MLVEEECLPPLDQLLLKHENVEDFFIFCECFLSKVVGVGAWRELCTKQKISDFATVSDEAFAYLLVENYWDGWSTRRSDEPFMESDLIHGSKKKKRKITWGKYTAAALGARRYGGWNKAGLERFNALCQEVKDDRIKNGAAVDELFKAHCIATLVTPKKPKQISICPFTSYNDDMSDLL